MKLTESQRQHLFDLLIACDRPRPDSDALVKKGLAERGNGRFGEWVRITKKGAELAMSWPEGERIARESRWVNARAAKDSTRMVDRGGRATSSVVLRADAVTTEQQSMPAAAARPPRAQKKVVSPRPISQQPAPSVASSLTQRAQTRTARTRHSSDEAALDTAPVHGRRRRVSARGDGAAGAVPPATPVTTTVAALLVSNYNTDVVTKTTSTARVGIAQVSSPAGRSAVEVVPNAVRVVRANKVTYYPLSMFGSLNDENKQRCCTRNRFYRSVPLAASESDQVVL